MLKNKIQSTNTLIEHSKKLVKKHVFFLPKFLPKTLAIYINDLLKRLKTFIAADSGFDMLFVEFKIKIIATRKLVYITRVFNLKSK